MSTRDPIEVLRERTARLEQELGELEARRQEQAALEGRAAQVKGALHESRTLLDRLDGQSGKRSLPMLDAIRIASPCSASWDDMVGDEKSRFCGKCAKNVYNLSAMTREEAEVTMRAKEGDLCVRLYQRADGTVLTQDCPVGVRRKRLRIVGVLALGSSLAGTAAAFGLALEAEPPPPPCTLSITPPETAAPAPGRPEQWTMGAFGGAPRKAGAQRDRSRGVVSPIDDDPLPAKPTGKPKVRPLMGKPTVPHK